MGKIIRILLGVTVLVSGFSAFAAISPVSVGIISPVQFPPSDFSVTGARVALLGHHRDVYGLDIGLLGNITDQDSVGIAFSTLFNITRGQTTQLLQATLGANMNYQKTTIVGLQFAGFLNMNEAESSVYGLQLALANVAAHTKINGFQVGIYNRALDVRGFQIGLVNVTDNLHGIQIGLVNFNKTGLFVVSPILNIGF